MTLRAVEMESLSENCVKREIWRTKPDDVSWTRGSCPAAGCLWRRDDRLESLRDSYHKHSCMTSLTVAPPRSAIRFTAFADSNVMKFIEHPLNITRYPCRTSPLSMPSAANQGFFTPALDGNCCCEAYTGRGWMVHVAGQPGRVSPDSTKRLGIP